MIRITATVIVALFCAACDIRPAPFGNAERQVRDMMKDPKSAEFRDLKRCGASDIIEGEVNAKNSYGAYSGYQRFIVDGDQVDLAGSEAAGTGLQEKCIEAIKQQTKKIMDSLTPEEREAVNRTSSIP